MHRFIVVALLTVLVVGALGVQAGSVPRAEEVLERLANRPEVADRFEDPAHGRFDATVFLFTCLLGVPFVVIGLAVGFALVHMALEATVLPVGRSVGLPDGLVVAGLLMVTIAVAYARTDLWLPRSLHILALISRAWVISTT